jgi:aldose 1-epimerase
VTYPSGEQVELAHGAHRAVVVEVGAGLREYTVDGVSVVDGYPAGEMCSGGRGQTLIPWPNRIAGGAYEFDGTAQQLPLTEPSAGNAIHGLTRWSTWTVVDRGGESASFRHVLHPQPGYPFTLDCRVDYALSDAGLRVRTAVTNIGDQPAPYGTGAHPYLTVGTETVDQVTLTVPGDRYLPTDDNGIPTGTVEVEGSPYDYRAGRLIGSAKVDHCFTDLARDADGVATVTLAADERRVRLWLDGGYHYVQVFTGDTLIPARRRRGLAVEPMTCPPDAFRSRTGLLVLEPGRGVETSWGIAAG